MGDMAEPWKSMRAERQKQVASGKRVSMRFKTEADREWHTSAQYEANAMVDKDTMKLLENLDLEYEKKGIASFMVWLPKGRAMLYTGKKGNKLHYIGGDKLDLEFDLEAALQRESMSHHQGNDLRLDDPEATTTATNTSPSKPHHHKEG